MTRTPRRLMAATGLAAALLLTGCGHGEVRPGAAAVVGGDRIDTDALQQLVDRGLADPAAAQQLGGNRLEFQRQALARLINRKVLDVAAKRAGVTVSEGDVDAQLANFVEQAGGRKPLEMQAAQSGISSTDLPPFIRDIVTEQKLGDALTAKQIVPAQQLQAVYKQNIAQYDKVQSRHILVPDEKTARTILKNVTRDPSRFPALAAQFSTDTSNKDKGGELGLQGRGQFVPEFEKVLFSAKVGSYNVVKTQFGWHVVNVEKRVTTSLADARPELRRVALQSERQKATAERLRTVGKDLGITVNPRFGRWDADTGTVVPVSAPDGVTSPDAGSSAGAGEPGGGGTAPGGAAPDGSAPQGTAPDGSAPDGSAPQGTAPDGSAPQGAAPDGASPAPAN